MSDRTNRIKSQVTTQVSKATTQVKDITDATAARAQGAGTVTAPIGTSDNPSNQVFTVANVITFCRLILTFVFLYIFCTHGNRWIALTCYVVAAVTDFLDGQVARRTQTVSWVGKVMDPIMDRVLLFTGVLGLLVTGELPLWIPLFVIGRDAYLTCGALITRHFRRRPIDVVYIGKIATACLMTGFSFLLLGMPVVDGLGLVRVSWLPVLNSQPGGFGILFVYVGILFSAATAVVYTVQAARIIRAAEEDE